MLHKKTDSSLHIIASEYLHDYLLGGCATITVATSISSLRYTYSIRRDKKYKDIYYTFIHLHDGWHSLGAYTPDDNHYTDYEYINLTKECWPQRHRLIASLLQHLTDYNILNKYIIYSHGLCSVCGRPLIDIESIRRGIGPECWRHLQDDNTLHKDKQQTIGGLLQNVKDNS